MKRRLVEIGLIAAVLATAHAAENDFSKTIRAEDFAAAGLGKLSAAEIQRLDALVRDHRAAAVESGAKEVVKSRDVAPAPLAKVKLAPGTQVEFASVESRIVGEFRGWEGKTLFTLENGQRWQTTGSDIYASPRIMNPAVKIAPGMMGSFWLTVEGVRTRVKVVPVGDAK